MPELPEVETMRRGIASVAGLRIASAEFPRGTRRPIAVRPTREILARKLAGRRIAAVARFGKRVGLELAPGDGEPRQWLLIEPRMTGLMLVAPPPTNDHVRLVLALESRRVPRLLFWDRRGLGTVRLVDERKSVRRVK